MANVWVGRIGPEIVMIPLQAIPGEQFPPLGTSRYEIQRAGPGIGPWTFWVDYGHGWEEDPLPMSRLECCRRFAEYMQNTTYPVKAVRRA
jgi:hypothetical protein